jgi:hypothetical protein
LCKSIGTEEFHELAQIFWAKEKKRNSGGAIESNKGHDIHSTFVLMATHPRKHGLCYKYRLKPKAAGVKIAWFYFIQFFFLLRYPVGTSWVWPKKRNARLWGIIFKEMSILFFKKAHNSFLPCKRICMQIHKKKTESTCLRSQQVFHQHFESMCWSVGGFLLLMSVNKTKTLTKIASSMIVAWWKRQCTYLPTFQRSLGWVLLVCPSFGLKRLQHKKGSLSVLVYEGWWQLRSVVWVFDLVNYRWFWSFESLTSNNCWFWFFHPEEKKTELQILGLQLIQT